MPISDHCGHQAVTAKPSLKVREAAELMKRENTGSLVIVERDRPVGILTDRDIALGTLADRRDPERTLVKEIMGRPAITISKDASVGQASRTMRYNALRRLPIVNEKGKLVGIVTSDDVLKLVTRELAQLGRAVESQTPEQRSAPVPAS